MLLERSSTNQTTTAAAVCNSAFKRPLHDEARRRGSKKVPGTLYPFTFKLASQIKTQTTTFRHPLLPNQTLTLTSSRRSSLRSTISLNTSIPNDDKNDDVCHGGGPMERPAPVAELRGLPSDARTLDAASSSSSCSSTTKRNKVTKVSTCDVASQTLSDSTTSPDKLEVTVDHCIQEALVAAINAILARKQDFMHYMVNRLGYSKNDGADF